MPETSRLIRLYALAGLIGPVWFGSVILGLTVGEYRFMLSLGWDPVRAPTMDWPSGLALGPYGLLMTLAFLTGGTLMVVFAHGLYKAIDAGQSGHIGSTLLVLSGLALSGLSFTTDPTLTTIHPTWHGQIHDASFIFLGLMLLPAMLFLSYAFSRDGNWRSLSTYTLYTTILALPTFILKGAAFYIFLLAILTWSETIAMRFWQLSK